MRTLTIGISAWVVLGISMFASHASGLAGTKSGPGSYNDLLKIFQDVRKLERTTTRDGIPDYTTATLAVVQQTNTVLGRRLAAIDTTGWTLDQKVDREVLRAEINGFDFLMRILQPWTRDPAFYVLIFPEQSDTPAHEGPISHAIVDLWKYTYPLSKDDTKRLIAQLNVIAPLLEQARENLIGNAKDLWIAGAQSIRSQASDLDELAMKTASSGKALKQAIEQATSATLSFAE